MALSRWYWSRLVLCCFKSLGSKNCTINTTIKHLCKCSMECFFCIWLARKNKAWSFKEIDFSLKTPEDSLAHQNPPSATSKTNSLKTNPPLLIGFINKGTLVTQMLSCSHWVSYHRSELEYHRSRHLCFHF